MKYLVIKEVFPTDCSPRKTSLNFLSGFPKSFDVMSLEIQIIIYNEFCDLNRYLFLQFKIHTHFVFLFAGFRRFTQVSCGRKKQGVGRTIKLLKFFRYPLSSM